MDDLLLKTLHCFLSIASQNYIQPIKNIFVIAASKKSSPLGMSAPSSASTSFTTSRITSAFIADGEISNKHLMNFKESFELIGSIGI